MENHTTDKINVQLITRICALKGIRHAVISPGSRNAPLMVAFNREPDIKCHVLVDERSAAFFGLGIAQQCGEPVVLVCTSGTALLNYAPAIAEAYYQRIPLLVISADRPTEWIDQDDSQTIRQQGVFASFVKASYQLPLESDREADRWFTTRMVNDAINVMVAGRRGPVHLNVPLAEPLFGEAGRLSEDPRIFDRIAGSQGISSPMAESLGREMSESPRVMIVASMQNASRELNDILCKLSARPNIIVLTETIANLKGERFIQSVDRTLSRIPSSRKADYMPDLLINFGGPVLSKFLKTRLKGNPPRKHWYIGEEPHAIDTFCALTTHIDESPLSALSALLPYVMSDFSETASGSSEYAANWHALDRLADAHHAEYVANAPWCDLKAFSLIIPAIPPHSRLQLSNGTVVRYHQLFKDCRAERVNCNRGTSGIDGSTSTAAGAAVVFDGITTLITGDLSFLYDSNGLWNRNLSPNLRIIVINNGGGGIFRFIKGPSELSELEAYFEVPHELDLEKVAALYGLTYICARNEIELQNAMSRLYEGDRPAMLEVRTPADINDQILRSYFK